jgi:hypothetical protein
MIPTANCRFQPFEDGSIFSNEDLRNVLVTADVINFGITDLQIVGVEHGFHGEEGICVKGEESLWPCQNQVLVLVVVCGRQYII